MISNGQKIFALIFIIVFLVGIFFAYRSDFKLHKEDFKGSWVGIALVLGIILMGLMIRFVLKNAGN